MKKSILVLCAAMLFLLTGCFDYDEALVINADGSGTIQIKVGVDKAYIEQMKAISEQMAKAMPDAGIETDPMATMFNKEDIEKTLAEDDSGVELLFYKTSEIDNAKVWDIKFSFKDWNNLDILDKALSSDAMGLDASDEKPVDEPSLLTRQEDGTWLFYRSFADMAGNEDEYGEEYNEHNDDYSDYSEYDDDDDNAIPDLGEYDNEALAQMAEDVETGMNQLAEDFTDMGASAGEHKMTFSITVFGDIIESNANSVDGKTATWEYSIEEMSKSTVEQTIIFK